LHEALDGRPIDVAADDIKPCAPKRVRDSHSHRTEADYRRAAHNSSIHRLHQ
jgi:hypothetical protein